MNLRSSLATLLFLFVISSTWGRATTDLPHAIAADTTPQWPLLEMPAFRYTIASPGEWEILPVQEDSENAEVRVTYDEATGISYLFVARHWPLWGEPPSLKEGLERAIEPLSDSRSLVTEWVDIAPLPEGGSALGAKLSEGGNLYGELRSFIIGPYTYFLGVFQEEGVLTDPSYLQYFDSFRYTPPAAVRWEQITQQAGAFAVLFPDNYKRSVTQTPFAEEPANNPYEICSLRAVDEANKIDAVVRYDLLPIGYQATDPHARLEAVLTTIEDKLPEATTATDQDWQGFPALRREYDMEHSTIWLQMIQRGNRTYILFIQFAPDQLAQARVFFNSFTLLPFTYGNSLPETKTSPDGVLTLSLPSGTLFSRDTLIEDSYPDWEKLRYLGRDTLSGLDFNVNINRFSPYWSGVIAHRDTVRERLLAKENLASLRDTVLNGQPAWLATYHPTSAGATSLSYYVWDTYALYELTFNFSEPNPPPLVQQFLSKISFQLQRSTPPQSTAGQLLTDYLNLTGTQAEDWWIQQEMDYYTFTAADLPALYPILKQVEQQPESALQTEKLSTLLREFRFNQDAQTLPFLTEACSQNSSSGIKALFLRAMVNIHNEVAYALLIEQLTALPPGNYGDEDYRIVFQAIKDSLAFASQYWEPLFALHENPALAPFVYDLLTNLVLEKQISPNQLQPAVGSLLSEVQALTDAFSEWITQDDDVAIAKYNCVNALQVLLGELPPSKAIQKYFLKAQTLPDPYLQAGVLDALLLQKGKPSPATYQAVLADPLAWHRFLTFREAADALNTLPEAYRQQSLAVKAYTYRYFANEYAPLTAWEVISTTTATIQGETYRLHWFTFSLEEYGGPYLGVAAQPNAAGQLAYPPPHFDFLAETYDPELLADQQAVLLEMLQEGEE